MEIVRLITCDNAVEAHLIQGKLNNEGIECFITNENTATLKPYFSFTPGFGVDIMIDEANLEKAISLLKDRMGPDYNKVICPYCGSDKVVFNFDKNKILKFFVTIILLMGFVPFRNQKKKYYCKKCRRKFK